jgi:RNA-directed DNA polymerase
MLANMALDGLEKVVKKSFPSKSKVHCVRYADDFVITTSTVDMLTGKVRPAIDDFLKLRGLTLSEKKTRITSIHDGFDFLGFNVRKYKGKFMTKPSRTNIKFVSRKLRKLIKQGYGWSQETLIRALNPVIEGWSNYYRHCCAKSTYGTIDNAVYNALYHWVVRRHQYECRRKWMARYFRYRGTRKRWIFVSQVKPNKGKPYRLSLKQAMDTKIVRHVKIKSSINLFDPESKTYFDQRLEWKRRVANNQRRSNRVIYAMTQQSRRIASK